MLIHPMPDPIAVHIGPLGVHWYGLMYLLAFAQFLSLGRVRIKQPHIAAVGWTKEDLDDIFFFRGNDVSLKGDGPTLPRAVGSQVSVVADPPFFVGTLDFVRARRR